MTDSSRTELVKRMPVSKAGLMPRTIDDVWILAERYYKSTLGLKNGLDSVEKVFVAGAMGIELGVGFFQGVQNIAVINGKAVVWGDLALALVQQSGKLEEIVEEPIVQSDGQVVGFTCTACRKDKPEPITHTFTIKDADRAGLLKVRPGKEPGVWHHYPQRMLQMRARAWTLRDGFADVLKGLQIREEMEGMVEAEVVSVEPSETRTDRIKAALGVPQTPVEDGSANNDTNSEAEDTTVMEDSSSPGTPGAAEEPVLSDDDMADVVREAAEHQGNL